MQGVRLQQRSSMQQLEAVCVEQMEKQRALANTGGRQGSECSAGSGDLWDLLAGPNNTEVQQAPLHNSDTASLLYSALYGLLEPQTQAQAQAQAHIPDMTRSTQAAGASYSPGSTAERFSAYSREFHTSSLLVSHPFSSTPPDRLVGTQSVGAGLTELSHDSSTLFSRRSLPSLSAPSMRQEVKVEPACGAHRILPPAACAGANHGLGVETGRSNARHSKALSWPWGVHMVPESPPGDLVGGLSRLLVANPISHPNSNLIPNSSGIGMVPAAAAAAAAAERTPEPALIPPPSASSLEAVFSASLSDAARSWSAQTRGPSTISENVIQQQQQQQLESLSPLGSLKRLRGTEMSGLEPANVPGPVRKREGSYSPTSAAAIAAAGEREGSPRDAAGEPSEEENASDPDDEFGLYLVQSGGSSRAAQRAKQSTKPRSVAERMRRERISVRLQRLKEVMPKTDARVDTAAMLEDAVVYIKSLHSRCKALERQNGLLVAQLTDVTHTLQLGRQFSA